MDIKAKIQQIKSGYYKIAEHLSAPKKHVLFAETPQHDGSAHVEYEGNELLYVITERGSRFEERRTRDPKELLYWLVSDLTWNMAVDYELNHRIENEDCRRQIFSKNSEYLNSINVDWAARKKSEYDTILTDHPFNK
jgi:hypothetical protein